MFPLLRREISRIMIIIIIIRKTNKQFFPYHYAMIELCIMTSIQSLVYFYSAILVNVLFSVIVPSKYKKNVEKCRKPWSKEAHLNVIEIPKGVVKLQIFQLIQSWWKTLLHIMQIFFFKLKDYPLVLLQFNINYIECYVLTFFKKVGHLTWYYNYYWFIFYYQYKYISYLHTRYLLCNMCIDVFLHICIKIFLLYVCMAIRRKI